MESVEAVLNLFYIRPTRVEDDGLMEGVFVPKDGGNGEGEELGAVMRTVGKIAVEELVELAKRHCK